jgi:ubiquinone/menaquinone biosynthesis C-methylase UbiE
MAFEIVDRMFKGENPSSIFEVGVCAGSLFKPYHEERKGLIVGGVDIHPVTTAKEVYPECADNFYQFDVTEGNWPISDNSYDIVFTIGTLLTMPNPFPTLKEMLRIAKDKIIIAEHHSEKFDEYGQLTDIRTGDTPKLVTAEDTQMGNYNYSRCIRNYIKVFEKLGREYSLTDFYLDKTIFKCKK